MYDRIDERKRALLKEGKCPNHYFHDNRYCEQILDTDPVLNCPKCGWFKLVLCKYPGCNDSNDNMEYILCPKHQEMWDFRAWMDKQILLTGNLG